MCGSDGALHPADDERTRFLSRDSLLAPRADSRPWTRGRQPAGVAIDVTELRIEFAAKAIGRRDRNAKRIEFHGKGRVSSRMLGSI